MKKIIDTCSQLTVLIAITSGPCFAGPRNPCESGSGCPWTGAGQPRAHGPIIGGGEQANGETVFIERPLSLRKRECENKWTMIRTVLESAETTCILASKPLLDDLNKFSCVVIRGSRGEALLSLGPIYMSSVYLKSLKSTAEIKHLLSSHGAFGETRITAGNCEDVNPDYLPEIRREENPDNRDRLQETPVDVDFSINPANNNSQSVR